MGIPLEAEAFSSSSVEHWQQLAGTRIQIGAAVDKGRGRPLSSYFARLGDGEQAPLPAPYEEIWVVLRGTVVVICGERTVSAGPGDMLLVPPESPGHVHAVGDVELVGVSVPAH